MHLPTAAGQPRLARVAIAILALVLMAVPDTASAAPGSPSINVSPQWGEVFVCCYSDGTTVTFEIFSAPPGSGGTLLFSGARLSSGGGQARIQGEEHNLTLTSGMFVRTTGASIVEDMVIAALRIDRVDADVDTVSGVAPPGSTVDVWFAGQENPTSVQVPAHPSTGAWTAGLAGIDWGDEIQASVSDADGDTTNVGKSSPVMAVFPTWGNVSARGFAAGAVVSFKVFASAAQVGGTPLTSTTRLASAAGDAEAQLPHGFELAPPMVVVVDDGPLNKQHTVRDVTLTGVDLATETVQGAASSGSTVEVNLYSCCPNESRQLLVTAPTGIWTADFRTVGGDITTLTPMEASIVDEDGDTSVAPFEQPRIGAPAGLGGVAVDGFFPGTIVTLEMFEAPGGRLVFGQSLVADEDGHIRLDCCSQSTEPGMRIRATDGLYTKVLDVVPISIDLMDPVQDVISGTAPPGASVDVGVEDDGEQLGHGRPIAGANGRWSVDFTDLGADFSTVAGASAYTFDADDDANFAEMRSRSMLVNLTRSRVDGSSWWAGHPLTLTVRDAANAVVYTGSKTAGAQGEALFDGVLLGFTLTGGMTVTMTDGIVSSSRAIPTATIAALDVVNDVASGTAPPNLDFAVGTDLGCGLAEHAVASGSSGAWSTDFKPDDVRTVAELCLEGIFVERRVAIVSADPFSDEIVAEGFAPNSSVNITVADPGGSPTAFSRPTDDAGRAVLTRATHVHDVVAGSLVEAVQGGTTKQLTVAAFTLDTVDPGTDTVGGTAPANATVVGYVDPQIHFRTVAGAGGSWTTTTPVFPSDAAEASVVDPEGDRTFMRKGALERSSGVLAPGGSLSTDTESDGATQEDPVETRVTSPIGGPVTIEERQSPAGAAPSTFVFAQQQVVISALQATPENPLVLTFRVDASQVPAREGALTMQLFRNGTPVPDCIGSTAASPLDPCISQRRDLPDGDAEITVLSSRASLWDAGSSNDARAPVVGPPTFSANPISAGQSTTLSAPVSDVGSGVARAEAFVGPDPGPGHGIPMTVVGSVVRTTLGPALGVGTQTVSVRAVDLAGNWSAPATVELVVTEGIGSFEPGTPAGPAGADTADRLAGADRVATAIAISRSSFPGAGSAGTVVLTRLDRHPDALAGTPLAVARRGPVLLTDQTGLAPAVAAEIERALPKGSTVHLLGGTQALAPAVETQVRALGYVVTRYAGIDRFETAVRIAESLGRSTILIADGHGFSDALSAGAAASHVNAAIVLSSGSLRSRATTAFLQSKGGSGTVTCVGGPACAAYTGTLSIVGSDRYDTSVKVAQRFFAEPTAAGLASGEVFADALGGGAHVGAQRGPLLLAPPRTLPLSVTMYLEANQQTMSGLYVYGGDARVGSGVVDAAVKAIGGQPA